MNDKDLEYIFNNVPYRETNYYPEGIKFSNPELQINFLKNNNINFAYRKGQDKKMLYIDLLRKDNSLIHTTSNLRYPTNSTLGIKLTRDKLKAEKYLKNFGVSTPESKVYTFDQKQLAKEESFAITNHPVVIKPLNASLGKGVVVNVSRERFNQSWALSNSMINRKRMLVQNYLEGFESRVTVMEGDIVSIICRIPPYVVGENNKSISELIRLKNMKRSLCGFLSRNPIKKTPRIKEFLSSQEKDFEYRPSDSEYVLLDSVSNISGGGEIVNITELISNEVKESVLNIVAALPGIYSGGLDIMFKSFDDRNPTLIEFNTYPVLALAMYPTFGPVSDPVKSYFESTISFDQFINQHPNPYDIQNSDQYIKNYLSFIKRKNVLLNTYFSNLL